MPWSLQVTGIFSKRLKKSDKAREGPGGYNKNIMYATTNPDLVNELRYALDVMEENSHLGLDNEAAGKLRSILVRRINEAEASARPAAPVRSLVEEAKVSA
jgi:Holliday junction resolvase RusA-like endonuclease